MVIYGEPSDMLAYYMADGEIAFILQQAGFMPKYKGVDGELYFKRTSKLERYLKENNL